MTNIGEEWRELRPQIGQFMCDVGNLIGECKNAEEMKEKAHKKGYDKGYKKGYSDKEKEVCDNCPCRIVFEQYHKNQEIMRKFLELPDERKKIVGELVEMLIDLDNPKE